MFCRWSADDKKDPLLLNAIRVSTLDTLGSYLGTNYTKEDGEYRMVDTEGLTRAESESRLEAYAKKLGLNTTKTVSYDDLL